MSSLKGVFIATQLNSTRRRVELSCVAMNTPLDDKSRRARYCSALQTLDADHVI